MNARGLPARTISDRDRVQAQIGDGQIRCVINVARVTNREDSDSFAIRRFATERNLPVLTCMDTAEAFLIAIRMKQEGACPACHTLEEYVTGAAGSGT